MHILFAIVVFCSILLVLFHLVHSEFRHKSYQFYNWIWLWQWHSTHSKILFHFVSTHLEFVMRREWIHAKKALDVLHYFHWIDFFVVQIIQHYSNKLYWTDLIPPFLLPPFEVYHMFIFQPSLPKWQRKSFSISSQPAASFLIMTNCMRQLPRFMFWCLFPQYLHC